MPHPASWLGFDALLTLMRTRTGTVLSGAGESTESGLPDYRGPDTRETDHSRIRYREFVDDARRGDRLPRLAKALGVSLGLPASSTHPSAA